MKAYVYKVSFFIYFYGNTSNSPKQLRHFFYTLQFNISMAFMKCKETLEVQERKKVLLWPNNQISQLKVFRNFFFLNYICFNRFTVLLLFPGSYSAWIWNLFDISLSILVCILFSDKNTNYVNSKFMRQSLGRVSQGRVIWSQ